MRRSCGVVEQRNNGPVTSQPAARGGPPDSGQFVGLDGPARPGDLEDAAADRGEVGVSTDRDFPVSLLCTPTVSPVRSCAEIGASSGEGGGCAVSSDLMLIGSPALPYSAVLAGLSLLAWVVGLIDVLCRDDTGVRLFPRWGWLLIVIAVPIVGTVVWLIFGRPRAHRARRARRDRGERLPSRAVVSEFPEYDRPGRFVPQDPAADAEFLRQCRQRAEEQRREAEMQRRRRHT